MQINLLKITQNTGADMAIQTCFGHIERNTEKTTQDFLKPWVIFRKII